MKKKICILGLGYIGLPTAAMFATHGHEIIGVDTNTNVVNALNQGKTIIEEPYLDIMVQAAVTSGNLTARTEPTEADVFIIAVPTPIKADKTAEMCYVETAAKAMIPYLKKDNVIILESTSPPGTVEKLLVPILEESKLVIGEELLIAHCPERVLPGRILMELVENNRIVGGINQKSCEVVRDLYRTFVRGEIFLTDATTAEMCKLMENTFRDVNIALANELAMVCEKAGINAWEVMELSNKHPRVNIHQPGPGVGGHCLAVDPWFIVEQYPEDAKMIHLSRKINDSMPHYLKNKIGNLVEGCKNKKIAILGLTYKPDIDDLRESPILELVHLLREEKEYTISLYDPFVVGIEGLEKDIYKAVEGADLIVLAVHHKAFKNLDFSRFATLVATKQVLDTRNYWDKKALEKLGFTYHLLGSRKSELL